MKLYLAGPMRGQHLLNYSAFFRAAILLRVAGHIVYNPAERDMANGANPADPSSVDLSEAFEWDFEHVNKADGIALLPGWRESQGACAEVANAFLTNKKVFEVSFAGNLLSRIHVQDVDINVTVRS